MTARHIILVVLSIVVGVASVFMLFWALNIFYQANVDIEKYGYGFALLTGLPVALAAAVWLDYFLGTNILPD